ncbi:MAG TPA: sigma-54 dependent transcriptional regulator [Pirellulales bacterium]|jgi:two-component system nitrogen regulation response regulator GlnG|nr:sigma-54 dependent transcriptional regulator [Pirellulales bacterium]
MPKLLAIDDDRSVLRLIEQAFAKSSFSVLSAGCVHDGLELIAENPDVVLLDMMLPDVSGLEAARQIHSMDPQLPVMFMTTCGNSELAIEAMKIGAYDYLLKPLDLPTLRGSVERALAIRRRVGEPSQAQTLRDDDTHTEQIIGQSPQMQEVFKAIGRVAPQDTTVLILGESGTGKELVARAIYHHSDRAAGPFLAVNCAAIPESLLESELFGHEKGAFTGAHQRRVGKFEQCSGGTIFLDEVGDMSPLVQSKVLRVLQEQQFERVGGSETIQANVRVIAATNRDLPQLVIQKQFREDLYYRLNGFLIRIPPLRDRNGDLAILLQYFLRRLNQELEKNVREFSPDVLTVLMHYPWPGNVRELETVVRQCLLQSTGPVILPEFMPESVLNESWTERLTGIPSSDLKPLVDRCFQDESRSLYPTAVELMDRYLLARTLRHTNGNQSKAAKMLGITRASLRRKLHARNMSVESAISVKCDNDMNTPAT